MSEEQLAEASEPVYTVKITGDGVAIEKTIPKTMAADLIQYLLSGGRPTAMPTARIVGAIGSAQGSAVVTGIGTAGEPPLSLAEYLEEINARRIPERILGMAAYLTEVTAQLPNKTFTKADIKPCFKAVGDPLPANFARDWSLVVSAGWIATEPSNPETFFVTRRGLSAIADKFATEAERVKRIRQRQNEGRGKGGSTVEEPSASGNEA